MVTSPHPLATQAGVDVLEKGGNAIEAAVATAATLTVVMPHFCGLGGDAVWLVADREGRRASLLGIGQAAARLPHLSSPIPLRGAGSTLTTACAVDSWDHALRYAARHWSQSLDIRDLLRTAIDLAENGYPPTRSQTFWLEFRAAEIEAWRGFTDVFDHRRQSGPFRQPELGSVLRQMQADGLRSFYDGPLARRIAEGLADAGSPLGLADLAATVTREEMPLSIAYRGLTLLAPPPPTQGLSTLSILGILQNFDLSTMPGGSADRIHLLVEAVKQAFLDRDTIADPDGSDIDYSERLEPDHLAERAGRIDMHAAMPWPHAHRHGDTVFFAVTDRDGRSASVLQSTYFDWGSGTVIGDTGILWQNRGAAFSTRAGHPNVAAPGKRPFYTLNPGMALKRDRPHLLYGTQGADGQPQTLAVVLTALIDGHMTPEQALAEPRFLLGKTFSDARDSLKLEASMGRGTQQALERRGHAVAELPALSPLFGQAGVIRIEDDGSLSGAHDPRGEGVALPAWAPADRLDA
ncbi:gamma-glutamyltransferase family protein [Rhizobium sp. SAFR-030]|uniref:gamma-glutamyltransferase family protein n=1 Tax=Rhizobium sp. SAFR-030 TaxID=3387277 RepID=UPI003F7E06FC